MKQAQKIKTARTLGHLTRLLRVIIVYVVALGASFSADLVELTRVGDWKRVPPTEGGASSARQVEVVGGVAFVADGNYGLEIIRTSDPSKPERIGGYDTGLGWNLGVRGEFVYVCDLNAGLAVLNISDPSKPQPLVGYRADGFAGGIAFQSSLAYVAWGTNGLHVLDLSEPGKPKFVSQCAVPGEVYDLAVSGDTAFVVDFSSGLLLVIDISLNPPEIVATYRTGLYPTDITVADGVAYVAAGTAGLLILDVREPRSPRLLSAWREDCLVWNLTLSGKYVYLSGGVCGSDTVEGMLRVVDVSDPSHPVTVGRLDRVPGARGLTVAGTYLYVAADHYGLQIYAISELPTIKIVTPPSDGYITLEWTKPTAGYVLQRSGRLNPATWLNVPGSEAVSTMRVPLANGGGFYRMSRQ